MEGRGSTPPACGRRSDQLYTLWREAVARSRATLAELLADAGPEQLAPGEWPDGETPSLRRIFADLIEECPRHVGHADLVESLWTSSLARIRPAGRGRFVDRPRHLAPYRPDMALRSSRYGAVTDQKVN
ncbi:DUF664 domain-containing protein [Micromonospora zamorensis]|uniref:mycothiol transferase n=1 Tax=Micromonospora zamorensis TaxID=709883 RepID=UPI0033AEF52B